MLRWCCDDVATALRRRGFLARKVMVKLRFPDLSYATKGHTLGCPTDAASVLYPQCANLLLSMMGMAPESAHAISLTRPVRLAGMSASGLVLAEEAEFSLRWMICSKKTKSNSVLKSPAAAPVADAFGAFAWRGGGA